MSMSSAICATEKNLKKTKDVNVIELQNILKALHKVEPSLPLQIPIADLGINESFSQQELIALCSYALELVDDTEDKQELPEKKALEAFVKKIISQLEDYKVTGIGFSHHLSAALAYSNPKFTTEFTFKNSAGESIKQTFRINYKSLGWHNEFLYRFDTILILDADLNAYNLENPLRFSTGFTGSVRLPLPAVTRNINLNGPFGRLIRAQQGTPLCTLGFTIMKIANGPGFMLIGHFGFGATGLRAPAYPFALQGAFNAAVVFPGGTMTACIQQ